MYRKRVLWVTPKCPWPTDDGAKMATFALLSNLPDRINVDLLSLTGVSESCDANALASAYGLDGKIVSLKRQDVGSGIIRHVRNLITLLTRPGTPATICRYATLPLRRGFAEALTDIKVVVFDGLHTAALTIDGCRFVKPKGVRVIYRAHNVEWELWDKSIATVPVYLRPLLKRQRNLMKRFEESVVASADVVAPVSMEDERTFKTMMDGCRTELTPIGLNFGTTPPDFPKIDDLRIVFIGRLDWAPNKDGLRWFLERVWSKIERRDIHLTIAGVGNGDWLRRLLVPLRRVDFLGRIESTDELYAKSHVAIAPIFYGSGTRLKTIEPARFGRTYVGTKAAALGSSLDVEQYFHAETASEWIDLMENLSIDECRERGRKCRIELMRHLDDTSIANRFATVLDELSK